MSRNSRPAADLASDDKENIESGPDLDEMEENKPISDDDSEMDVKDAALNLFNLILKPVFDRSTVGYIGFSQYESAVRSLIHGEPEQI